MTDPTYTTGQLALISGISSKHLRRWDSEGILLPALRKARGAVTDRIYSLSQALGIVALGELRRAGFGPGELRRAAQLMPGSIQDFKYLVFAGRMLCLRSDPEQVIELLEGRSGRVIKVEVLLSSLFAIRTSRNTSKIGVVSVEHSCQ